MLVPIYIALATDNPPLNTTGAEPNAVASVDDVNVTLPDADSVDAETEPAKDEAVIVLFDNASVPANVANVPVVGRVTLVTAVVVNVNELAPEVIKSAANVKLPPNLTVLAAFTISSVNVLPAVNVVEDVAANVTSNAALVSRIANPVKPAAVPPAIVAVLIVGEDNVLFVRVSVPANVANVPVDGKVTEVVAVAVNVVVNAPDVVKLPPNVIVLPVLATPVPPYCPATTPPCQVLVGLGCSPYFRVNSSLFIFRLYCLASLH